MSLLGNRTSWRCTFTYSIWVCVSLASDCEHSSLRVMAKTTLVAIILESIAHTTSSIVLQCRLLLKSSPFKACTEFHGMIGKFESLDNGRPSTVVSGKECDTQWNRLARAVTFLVHTLPPASIKEMKWGQLIADYQYFDSESGSTNTLPSRAKVF